MGDASAAQFKWLKDTINRKDFLKDFLSRIPVVPPASIRILD